MPLRTWTGTFKDSYQSIAVETLTENKVQSLNDLYGMVNQIKTIVAYSVPVVRQKNSYICFSQITCSFFQFWLCGKKYTKSELRPKRHLCNKICLSEKQEMCHVVLLWSSEDHNILVSRSYKYMNIFRMKLFKTSA